MFVVLSLISTPLVLTRLHRLICCETLQKLVETTILSDADPRASNKYCSRKLPLVPYLLIRPLLMASLECESIG